MYISLNKSGRIPQGTLKVTPRGVSKKIFSIYFVILGGCFENNLGEITGFLELILPGGVLE